MFMELMHLIKLDNNWHNATQGTGNNGFSQLMQGPGGGGHRHMYKLCFSLFSA